MAALRAFDCVTGEWLSSAELDASMAVEPEGFIDQLDDLRSRLGPDASAAEGIEAYLAHSWPGRRRAPACPAGTQQRASRRTLPGLPIDSP